MVSTDVLWCGWWTGALCLGNGQGREYTIIKSSQIPSFCSSDSLLSHPKLCHFFSLHFFSLLNLSPSPVFVQFFPFFFAVSVARHFPSPNTPCHAPWGLNSPQFFGDGWLSFLPLSARFSPCLSPVLLLFSARCECFTESLKASAQAVFSLAL